MRILIAEDDQISRRLLEAQLTKWGYDVIVACNGAEAWMKLQEDDAPRLAILDWMMPEMDGPQVCGLLRNRENAPYVYTILLTAKSQKEDLVNGLSAGADDYVTKPFDPHELQARLRAGIRILDLQAELVATRESLRVQATHDPLTGLPNRLLFADRLAQRLAQAKRYEQRLAVMFCDLDRFKFINDTLGHNVGDLLLKTVTERLISNLREVDTIARMGGDEFTLILPDVVSSSDATNVAKRILQAFKTSFVIDDNELFVSSSIGIAIYPDDGDDAETLVKNADTAMYRAKEKGRNDYQLYTDALNKAALERMSLENSLRRALERDEFLVYYQPQVKIDTGIPVGAEALVRWKHPELGLISPAQFIPIAEDTGLIVPISMHVLRAACLQNKAWHDMGYTSMTISVNTSPRQFQDEFFAKNIEIVLNETGMQPHYLELELTEGALMHNTDKVMNTLTTLKDMGVHLSIDDFGTGYSSLNYLKRLPIDAVKIDRSFIKDITTDPDDEAIAQAVIAMARSLKLRVIAEGVESLEQLELLRSLGCDEMQGYFVSPPVPSDDFEQMMRHSFMGAVRLDKAA